MAQQNIDFGTFPDDPDADPIRIAFQKVQNNFNELYAATSDAAVKSINRTPGAGVTVDTPTGNVIITANISQVSVRTSTLSMGIGANGGIAANYTSSGQLLYIDLPTNIITSGNVQANGFITSNSYITANGNITSNSNIFANSGLVRSNTLSVIGDGSIGGNLNVTGNIVANSIVGNFSGNASTAGTVTTNAQPNITSVGTLTSLTVTGNIAGGNITTTGLLTSANATLGNTANANYFVGNFYGTANSAGTVTTAAQPNITSVGTLTNLSVTGNITSGNANLGNSVTANYFTGNFYGTANSATVAGTVTTASQPNITSVGNLSNLTSNGTIDFTNASNVSLGNLANIKILGGTANYTIKTDGNGNLSWGIDTTAAGGSNTQVQFNDTNVLGGSANFVYDKLTSNLTLIGNANLGNTVSANFFFGAGNNLSNIQGANVSGAVSSATSATTAGTVTTAAQPNITSLGTLTGLTTTGTANFVGASNVSLGSVSNVKMTGAAGYLQSDGNGNLSFNTVITQSIPGAANALLFSSGTNGISASGNIFFNDPQLAITGTLSVTGNANLGNAATANFFIGSGNNLSNIQGSNVTGAVSSATTATTAGTVTNASQSNITSVGTLTSLSVSGNITQTGIQHSIASGTLTNPVPSLLITQTWNNSSVTFNPIYVNITDTSSQANSLFAEYLISGSTKFAINKAGNAYSSGTIQASTFTSNVSTGTAPFTVTSTTQVANLNAATAGTAGTVTTAAQPNITSLGTLTSLGVNGTVTAVNFTANTGVFTGNGNGISSIQGANVTGTVANATYATSAGSATTATSATSATTAGTVTTAAQPNITSVGTLTSLSSSGNISGANVTVTGYHIRSVGTGISANGSTQGTATAISKELNVVSTVSSGQGVVLPTAVAGMVITITNTSANSLSVYPATSGAINNLSANAAYTHPSNGTVQYYAPTTTQWYTIGGTYA